MIALERLANDERVRKELGGIPNYAACVLYTTEDIDIGRDTREYGVGKCPCPCPKISAPVWVAGFVPFSPLV